MPLGALLGPLGGAILGDSLSGDSGSQIARTTAETEAIGRILGEFVPGAIGAQAEAFNNGGQLQVDAILAGLNGALGASGALFGEANNVLANVIGSGVERGLGLLGNNANAAIGRLNPLAGLTQTSPALLQSFIDEAGRNDFLKVNENDPGFQFQLQRGNDAINAGANARGLLNSGGRLRELSEFNQGLANTFRNNELANQRAAFQTRLAPSSQLFNAQFGAGINAVGNQAGIQNGLGVNSSNLVFNGASQIGNGISNNLVNQAGIESGLFAGLLPAIGTAENNALIGAANSTLNGLFNQAGGFTNLVGAQNGVQAGNLGLQQFTNQNIANTAQGIGNILGGIFDTIRVSDIPGAS